jgi:hypothetical protein
MGRRIDPAVAYEQNGQRDMEILVVFAAVAAAVVLIRCVRSRRRLPSMATADVGVPTFRVVALGPRGSGKTMLLASMYQQLQVPHQRSYFLTASHGDVVQLNHWFAKVADPGQDWDAGTRVGDVREFAFSVRTRAPSGTVHTVMNLGYLEYAGGLLTEPQAPGTFQPELVERIRSADALIGIIDGYRVQQWLDGKTEGQVRLQHAVSAMVNLMLEASCPITFIVTKWDLLRDIDADEDARLGTVSKLLLTNPGFRELVATHGKHRVVRLIPVSAVGPTFAELNARGEIVKRPDGQMQPTNVDVPLAAVIPDIFEPIQHSMDDQKLQSLLAGVRSQADPLAALAVLGSYVMETVGRFVTPAYLSFAADALIGLASPQGAAADQQAGTERRLSEAERTIEEFRMAQRRVIRDFQSRVDILEGRLPSSRLSGDR